MTKKRVKPPILQPLKCVACKWGRWEGAIHFCMFVNCVKGGEDDVQKAGKMVVKEDVSSIAAGSKESARAKGNGG